MPVKRDPRTGRWFFRATIKFPDKTRKRIFGTPGVPGPYQDLKNTKVGAETAETRAKVEAVTGRPALVVEAMKEVPKAKTIREHAENFVELYKPGSKPSEKRSKTYSLDSHLLPFFGDITIEALKQTDVDTFATAELKRGMSVKTTNNRLAVLSTLIKYVTKEKSKLRFKLDGMTGELSAVAPADVEKLINAAADQRYRVLVLLASEAGLRAGEIRGLQWGDIKDGQATIRRALDNTTNEVIAPKHNKSRTVPLSPRIVAALAALPRLGLWVVSRLDGGALGYFGMIEAVVALYAAAGVVKPAKPIHCLRHSFGTVMAQKVPLGVVQKLMGHADIQTTLRYVDVNEEQKRDDIALVFGVVATRQQRSKK